MCGIVGCFLNRPLQEADLQLGQAGMTALRHRGPDDSGFWADREAGVFLGHTRLSIIDLSAASHQPMERQDTVIAYNGELYNFQELRAELEASGVRFSTRGDTEVLLQAWRAWGTEALDRFDGMFAFALYHDHQLHLVTDPFGEKPLYWAKIPGGIYFASEAGVLARLLGCPPELGDEDLAAFLSLGFLPAPRTGYRDLYRMPPATHMVVDANGIRSTRHYWTPPQPVRVSGKVLPLSERAIDTLHGILLDSLRHRVYSDAPLGIFLSSGTDSSLVAAMAVRELGLTLQAFTVAFPDGRDESAHATQIAHHLGLPHAVINSREDPARVSPSYVHELLGELNDNLTVVAVRQMALVASPYMKAALTGMGGDELFYGYGRYQLLYRYRGLFSLPGRLRKVLSQLVGALPQRRGPWQTLHTLCVASDACRLVAVKNRKAFLWLWALPELETVAQRLFPCDGRLLVITAHEFDLAYTMPASYILAMERGSMREGLEVRTPYLHRKLLEMVAGLDPRALVAFGQKQVLKRILARYLPPHLVERPKRGFAFPLTRFLNGLPEPPLIIPGIPSARTEAVWSRRAEPGWQVLAVRLAILRSWVQQRTGCPASLDEQVAGARR